MSGVFGQFWLLTKKNLTVNKRRPVGLATRIVLPFALIFLFVSVRNSSANSAFSVPDPIAPGGGIPPCRDFLGGDDCVTVRWDTNGGDAGTAALMARVQELSGLPDKDFEPLTTDQGDDPGEMGALIWDLGNQTSAVVIFHDPIDVRGDGGGHIPLPFTTYVNGTRFADQFQATPDGLTAQEGNIYYHLSEHIWRAQMELSLGLGAGELDIEPTYTPLPPLSSKSATAAAKAFDTKYGLMYLLAPLTILFHAPVMEMINERSQKLHQGMVLMGLKQSAYVASWVVLFSLWAVATTAIILVVGAIVGTHWIDTVDFSVAMVVYGGYGLATIAFGVMAGAFIMGSRNGIGCASFYYTIFGFIMFITGISNWDTFMFDFFWNPEAAWNTGRYIVLVLQFTPFWQVAQVWADIARVTGAGGGFFGGGGGGDDARDYVWDDLNEQRNITVTDFTYNESTGDYDVEVSWYLLPSPMFHLTLLYSMIFAYTCIAWLLYHVRPGPYGAASNPLNPRFWGYTPSLTNIYSFPGNWKRQQQGGDPDVTAIVESTFNPRHASQQGLVIAGLTKKFGSHAAVDGISFNTPKTGCVSVLGHNGAGKTTTINLILGLHSITSGNAVVCGQSSKDNVNGVRSIIGICPQHDVLWDELTARETLHMFANLKGVFSNTSAEVEKALAAVRLTTVADQFVSSYSGGMKRRLSVALATLGSPKAIFLDEPTAGLDPLNKRHIWELVQSLKKDRLVVLTSHSMMEADALSDIVAVMAGGQLKAFGPSLKLKERYGLGYHIDIVTKPGNEQSVISLVSSHMGDSARLDASNAGNLNFSVPSHAVDKLTSFLTVLEKESSKNRSLISDFGVSHTTLEEVFLNITSGSAAAKAQAEARAHARAMRANSKQNLVPPPAYSALPPASSKGGSRRRAPGSQKGGGASNSSKRMSRGSKRSSRASAGSKRGSSSGSKRMSTGSKRNGGGGGSGGSNGSKRGSRRGAGGGGGGGSTGSKRGGSKRRDPGAYSSKASNTSL